jgi:hypothetical protein
MRYGLLRGVRMNWTQVTPDQRDAAAEWWNARTIAERERDWPERTPNRLGLMSMHWRAWDGQSRASLAAVLIEAGLIGKWNDLTVPFHQCNDCKEMIPDHLEICAKCERWYEDSGLPLPTQRKPVSSESPKQVQEKRSL